MIDFIKTIWQGYAGVEKSLYRHDQPQRPLAREEAPGDIITNFRMSWPEMAI